jgi:hypothetical protein
LYCQGDITLFLIYLKFLSKRAFFSGDCFSAADTITAIILAMPESLELLASRTITQAYFVNISKGRQPKSNKFWLVKPFHSN